MTAHIISSGQTSTYDSLNAGDTVSVLSGGESDGSVIVSAAVEYVFSSGFSVGDTVNAGATQVIEFGGLAFFDTVLGSQYVYGSAVDDTISGADAYQYVEGGGTAVGETLLDTGYQSALNGALTSGTQIGSTGVEFVLSGAISISTTVSAGGDLDVYSGGQVSAATVLAGGFLEELGVVGGALIGSSTDAGLVEGLTVGDPFVDDTLEVLEGGSALGVTVTIGGDYLDVDSGGTATGTIVSSGGTESVASGGVTTGDLVLASGIETLASGATAGDVTVSAGGFLGGPGLLTGESNTVAGTVSGVVVGDSVNVDTLEILAGGAAVSVTVTIIDDVLTVDSGGTATGTAIVDEASAVIYGSAIDTKVGSAGICYVESGGVTSGDIVRASGTEILTAGATARSVTVAAGGFLGGPGTLISVNTAAGTVSGVVVGDPFYDDSLEIRAGGAAQNVTTYINGDYLMVDSGATATGTVDSAGGYDIVKGTVTGTTVMSASTEYVYSGGVANATTVRSAGAQYLIGGGTDVGGSVASGGALVLESTSLGAGISIVLGVNAAGTLSGMTLSAGALIDLVDVTLLTGATDAIGVSGVAIESILEGGREHVRSGGYSDDTVISSGGIEYLLNTGSSISATVSSGGSIYTSSGGMAFDTTIRVGGSIYVSSAGQSISAVLYSGGAETVLLSGIASATHVVSGGAVHVSSGGATSVTRLTGGNELVSSGGIANRSVVTAGGKEYISAGGVSKDAAVGLSGFEILYSGGTASAATISAGGALTVAAGGQALQTTVLAGGDLVLNGSAVWSGAAAATLSGALSGHGSLIEDGTGALVVSALATTFAGQALISGGTIELTTDGLGTGTVNFASTTTKKTLEIAATDQPANDGTFGTAILNLDSTTTNLDLAGLTFATGATATLAGHTLTLHDGAYTAAFTLSGTGASAYKVFSDGAEGTEIRAAAGSTQMPLLAQAVAAFQPSAAAHPASPISAGPPATNAIATGLETVNHRQPWT